jgi:hypothetical protein
MTTAHLQSFAPTTVRQLKQEVAKRSRTRVAFNHPDPIDEDTRHFPFIESGVQQWPGDHPHRPHQLYVPIANDLIRSYQRHHPHIKLLARMTIFVTDKRLGLPILPEGDSFTNRLYGLGIHSDNLGWRFGEAPEESGLWLFDPTTAGDGLSRARVRWEQHDYLRTRVLVVDPPPGLKARALELVDQQLAAIRRQFVDEWLGGPEALRGMLGLA